MDIREAQAALVALGYSLVVDNKPGPATKAAIQAFQVSHGLHVDGIIGPKTTAALNVATAGRPQGVSVIDRAKFFAYLRSGKAPMFGSSLSTGQVRGIEGILDGFAQTGDGRDKTLGYGLATARREIGSGMVPVREGFSKTDAAARAYVAKHYPNKGYSKPAGPWGHVYYGRGIVQLTWFDNYEREGIAADLDRALAPEFAAELMFAGLLDGRWNKQGKGIAYLPTAGHDDLKNARRTVNLTDHWEEIASFYRQFMAAIAAART
ncbi:peptidoglycan-binding protein [Bosea sp. SSUT16]|jgi:hypothetical protein|uniref:Peptidoglycan-binding protein n=1 Tax=Bosea spartocytisi TaxID=2773451 RepID=A0A927E4Z4_9HYPH|nr:peptidoglycan-binding protein [Bosea spartocytisi]MBD3844881.1 peptidoglycan-binding protein [Bosea spartocytisi]MCT4471083.1 peptidoglycan-binding protein [Bosea spartocytisi]